MRGLVTKADPKIGIYFSHYECFGHTSRVAAISEVFKKRFPSGNLFFIQAGVTQPKSQLEQWGKIYSLPKAFVDRNSFREPIQPNAIDTEARSVLCRDIITRQKPDLFVTEFFPLGREESRYELIPSLVEASKGGAAVWSVAGYPLLTGTKEWRQNILKLFQKIIIFSPEMEKDRIVDSLSSLKERQRYLDFFKEHEQKIIFAGYLLPEQEVVKDDTDVNSPRPSVAKGAYRIAVVRGGGAVYPKVIAEAIRASELLGPDYYFTVVTGPSTTTQEWYLFSTLMAKKKVKNLVLRRSLGDYEGLIKSSDACVSLASYHSSVMLLKHHKRAVIVPFEGYGAKSHSEQPARARMLKDVLGAQIVPYQELTAESLARSIKKVCTSRAKIRNIPKEWFSGAKILEKHLTELSLL